MSRPEGKPGVGDATGGFDRSSARFPRFRSAVDQAGGDRGGPDRDGVAPSEPLFPPGPIQPALEAEAVQPLARRWRSARWMKWVAAMAIAVTALTGIGLLVSSLGRGGSDSGGVRAGRPAPPGWSGAYAWARTVSGAASVAVEFNRVAYLDAQRLVVLDASSGQERFVSAPLSVSPNAKPFIATAQGMPTVGVIDGANLLLWPLETSSGVEPQQVTLAPNAKLHHQAGGLMVSTGKEHWLVTAQGKLMMQLAPADEVALGVTPAGEFVSAPRHGQWTVSPSQGTAHIVRVAHPPDGAAGPVEISWLSRGVVAAWAPSSDPNTHVVGLYDADSGAMLAQGKLPASAVLNGMPLTVSPQRRLASAGPMLSELDPNRPQPAVVMDRWSTMMSDAKNLYGTRDGIKMSWDGMGQPRELDPKTIIPWGNSTDGLAIVMEPLASGQLRVGGLRP